LSPKTPKNTSFLRVTQPQGSHSPYILGDTTSFIKIGSKTAEKNSPQTNRQTNRHYENNDHLAVNQLISIK